MHTYYKDFDIRWSDIDANRHLSNAAYINYMSHTRMAFLVERGFTQKTLMKHNLGPIVFYEHVYYFKELMPQDQARVYLQLKGLSEDGMFFSFEHNIYNQDGKHSVQCEMLGSWIDLKTRKLTSLPDHLHDLMEDLDKTEDFKVLTKEDTRKFGKKPKDMEPLAK